MPSGANALCSADDLMTTGGGSVDDLVKARLRYSREPGRVSARRGRGAVAFKRHRAEDHCGSQRESATFADEGRTPTTEYDSSYYDGEGMGTLAREPNGRDLVGCHIVEQQNRMEPIPDVCSLMRREVMDSAMEDRGEVTAAAMRRAMRG